MGEAKNRMAIRGAHTRRDGDIPVHTMLQESQLTNFWRERMRNEGVGHDNWRAHAYTLQQAQPRIEAQIASLVSETEGNLLSKTQKRRDMNHIRAISTCTHPTGTMQRTLPPRSQSALPPPPKPVRPGA